MKLTPQEIEAWRLSDEHTEEAIRSLSFRPNRVARQLKTRSTT